MKWKNKNAVISLFLGSIAIGVAFVSIRYAFETPILTQRGKRIVTFPYEKMHYTWLNDHQFMLLPKHMPSPLTSVDSRTGIKRVYDEFQKVNGVELNELNKQYELSDWNFTISPDGGRALWGSMSYYSKGVSSAPLDGGLVIKRESARSEKIYIGSNMIWTSDSRRWVQVVADGKNIYAFVEGLDSPGFIRKIPLGYPKDSIGDNGGIRTTLLGWTKSGSLLASNGESTDFPNIIAHRTISFFEFNVDDGPVRLREYSVKLPNEDLLSFLYPYREPEVVLSPGGDRLGWIVFAKEGEAPLHKLLARWIPKLRKQPRNIIELCTSRLDGSGMKMIGFLDYDKIHDNPKAPFCLRWLPNGKSLSFIFDNALWTIPADN